MKKILFVLPLVLLLSACAGKVYKPDPKLPKNQMAYVKIDGSKTDKSSFLTSRISFVNIEEYLGNCQWDYKGYMYASSNKSSKTLAVRAGKLMGLHFIRQVSKGNTTTDYEYRGYIKPRAGYTYIFQPVFRDDEEPNVYQVYKGKKRAARGFVSKPRCK